MSGHGESSLRDQLVAARTKIIAQLDELRFRATAVNDVADREGGGPPDYRAVFAELEEQLCEIDALLADDDENSP